MTRPLQPLYLDEDGRMRFEQNAIVRFLYDTSQFNMNALASMPFSQEDFEQFYQLIGYSLTGFGELPVRDSTLTAALANANLVVNDSKAD